MVARLLGATLMVMCFEATAAADDCTQGDLSNELTVLCLSMKQLEAAKAERRDREYAEKWWKRPRNLLLEGSQVQASFGFTDNDGSLREGRDVPLPLDDTQVAHIRVGWFDKPILRDLRFLLGPSEIKAYREQGPDDPRRVAFWDAIKFDAFIGYGDTVKETDGSLTEDTEKGQIKYIGVRYEIPLHILLGAGWEE